MLDALAWPVTVVVLGFGFMLVFRSPIAALLGRTKRVSKSGLETFEVPQLPATTEKSDPLAEFLGSYDNQLLKEQEAAITADLKQRGLSDPQNAQRALIRSLAGTQILLAFEKIQAGIWASQVSLLTRLHSSGPTKVSEVRVFYDAAALQYPELYQRYSFDNWLAYLRSYSLIEVDADNIKLTRAGLEFLKWRLEDGRAGPFHG